MAEPSLYPPVEPQPPLSPRTTAQEDLTHAGQRRINLLWEATQSVIAVSMVLASIIVSVAQGLEKVGAGLAPPVFPPILSNALFLIVGFYFSRTNHAAIGGVGPKPVDSYQGR
jgi:hypothetical protein